MNCIKEIVKFPCGYKYEIEIKSLCNDLKNMVCLLHGKNYKSTK